MTSRDGDNTPDLDVNNVKPPVSFDPSIFDQFDLGGWSTNVNNPYVAAAYVRARQGMSQQNDRKSMQNNAAEDNKGSSTGENRLLTRDEKAILERRKAWERARAEEKDDD
jgi:hypothetical protein